MKRLALLLVLCAPLFAQQVNNDVIPASPGLNLGHSNQPWNGYFNNLTITGTCVINGVSCLSTSLLPNFAQNIIFGGNNTYNGTSAFNGASTFASTATMNGTANFNGLTFFNANSSFTHPVSFSSSVAMSAAFQTSGTTNLNGLFYATNAALGAIGPNQGTVSPLCVVDGFTNQTTQACINYLTNLGFASSGTIWSMVPEHFTTNIFAINNFRGKWIGGHQTGTGDTCSTAPPYTCYLTDVPLIMPTHLIIEGQQNPSRSQGAFNSGTVFTFSTVYPSALGAPSAPSLTCGTVSGGTLSNGTYSVKLAEASNKLGLANNSNSNSTPGYGGATASLPVTCAAGGSGQAITFTAPAVLGTGQFIAQDLMVYSGASAGAELENVRGVNLATSGGCSVAGAVDANGCNLNGGTITVTALGNSSAVCVGQTAITCGFGPPLVDQSTSLFTMGTGVPGTNVNTFGVRIEHATLAGSPANSTTPAANEPTNAITINDAEEQSGPRDVTITGPFSLNGIYAGLKSGNCTMQGIHMPSNDGPNTGTFIPIIVEGLGSGNGGCREIMDSTIAARCSGCGSQPTVPEMIEVLGNSSGVGIHDVHIENDVGGDGVLVTSAASADITNLTGFADTGKCLVHISATADKVRAFASKDGKANAAICDDATGFTVTPSIQQGASYTNVENVGSLGIGATAKFTSGAGAASGNCTVGSIYTNTSAASASTVLYVCQPVNTWTAVTVP